MPRGRGQHRGALRAPARARRRSPAPPAPPGGRAKLRAAAAGGRPRCSALLSAMLSPPPVPPSPTPPPAGEIRAGAAPTASAGRSAGGRRCSAPRPFYIYFTIGCFFFFFPFYYEPRTERSEVNIVKKKKKKILVGIKRQLRAVPLLPPASRQGHRDAPRWRRRGKGLHPLLYPPHFAKEALARTEGELVLAGGGPGAFGGGGGGWLPAQRSVCGSGTPRPGRRLIIPPLPAPAED